MGNMIKNLPDKGLWVSLTVLLVAVIAGGVWILQPVNQVLFNGLDDKTTAKAVAFLEQNSIPHEVTENTQGNDIWVDENQASSLKVKLKTELGLPDVQGLELFENADYSMTDFTQQVTYKRALQGELARTISSMPGVKSARLHITFANKALFKSRQQGAKASVYVELTENGFGPHQVKAIQRLVANGVENLSPESVAVFGSDGVQLNQTTGEEVQSGTGNKMELKAQFEQNLTDKAYGLLSLVLPAENLSISVDVSMNFDQKKRMTQDVARRGDDQAVTRRKESFTRDTDTRQSEPVVSKNTEVEYIHGKNTEETVYATGRIQRIAVAALTTIPLSMAEVAKVRNVLSAGLGLQTQRGDQLAVEVIKGYLKPIVTKVTPIPAAQIADEIQQLKIVPDQNEPGLILPDNWPVILIALFALILLSVSLVKRTGKRLSKQEQQVLLTDIEAWLKTKGEADEHV